MTTEQQQVREFMLKAGQECPDKPCIPSMEVCLLRLSLIDEENKEMALAMAAKDPAETYDAILDLIYVVIGTAVACGMEIEPGWQEVCRNNMRKVWPDGTMHKDSSGKVIKPTDWTPPDLSAILNMQHE